MRKKLIKKKKNLNIKTMNFNGIHDVSVMHHQLAQIVLTWKY